MGLFPESRFVGCNLHFATIRAISQSKATDISPVTVTKAGAADFAVSTGINRIAIGILSLRSTE